MSSKYYHNYDIIPWNEVIGNLGITKCYHEVLLHSYVRTGLKCSQVMVKQGNTFVHHYHVYPKFATGLSKKVAMLQNYGD